MSQTSSIPMNTLKRAGMESVRTQHADIVAGLELLYPDAERISLSINDKDVDLTIQYPKGVDGEDVKHLIRYAKSEG